MYIFKQMYGNSAHNSWRKITPILFLYSIFTTIFSPCTLEITKVRVRIKSQTILRGYPQMISAQIKIIQILRHRFYMKQ